MLKSNFKFTQKDILIFVIYFILLSPPSIKADTCKQRSLAQKLHDWSIKTIAELQVSDVKNMRVSCPLHEVFNQRQIYFIGEDHSHPTSRAVKDHLFELAHQNKIQLYTEVGKQTPAFPWLKATAKSEHPEFNSDNVIGIESHLSAAITTNYFRQSYIHNHPQNRKISLGIAETATGVKHLPLYSKTFQLMKKNKKSCKECIEMIEILSPVNSLGQMELAKKYNKISDEIWVQFLNEFHTTLINYAKKQFPDIWKKHNIELFNLTDAQKTTLFFDPDKEAKQTLFRKLSHLRSIDMANSIIQNLCSEQQSANKNSKPIVVLTGKNHSYDLIPIFFTLSGKKINQTIYPSYDFEISSDLLKKLSGKNYKQ